MKLVTTSDLIRLDHIFPDVCHDITSLLAIDNAFRDGDRMTGCSTCALCNEVVQQWTLLPIAEIEELSKANIPSNGQVWKHFTTQAEIDHVTSDQHQAQKTLNALAGT